MATAVVFIPLTKGKVTVVDFDDFELVRPFKWHAHRNGTKQERWTACRAARDSGRQHHVFMHQTILGGKGIDHVNGDSLDNRRSNLRIATQVENGRGYRRKPNGTTSKFRGVVFHKGEQKWVAHIQGSQTTKNGKRKQTHLGYFPTEEAAAKAFDEAAIRYGYSPEALNFK